LVVVLALEPAQHNPIDLEGTYRLVSRDLPDGSTITPPDIEGMITFANGYRNFNVYWHDETGKATSISIIAEYELTEDTYTETNIYAMTNDEIAGTGVTYDLESTSGSAPVTREDGSLSMKLPLRDEPAVVIDEDGFTATREGEFVDHWERIE
jgi:hypothetical protein